MNWSRRKLAIFAATIITGLATALGVGPLARHGISTLTAGIVVGVLCTLSLVGLIYGIGEARRLETKRKAKDEIWMKH